MNGENGLREALSTLRREADRLWEHKASKTEVAYVRENQVRFEAAVQSDIAEIKDSIAEVKKVIERRADERVEERKSLDHERKTDRRWYIGTVLAALGLVIAAMAILIPILTGGPA
jgi:hypothetical protein